MDSNSCIRTHSISPFSRRRRRRRCVHSVKRRREICKIAGGAATPVTSHWFWCAPRATVAGTRPANYRRCQRGYQLRPHFSYDNYSPPSHLQINLNQSHLFQVQLTQLNYTSFIKLTIIHYINYCTLYDYIKLTAIVLSTQIIKLKVNLIQLITEM